jgi:uncharacterized delta-60 repeat protein
MKNKIAILLVLLFATYSFNANAQPGANDPTFNPTDVGFGLGDGADYSVRTTVIQSDGKIIIGGYFTTYNGTAINRIARLNADGSLDDTFNPGTGASNEVRTISLQSDGKIIIGGRFGFYNGIVKNCIARLNIDGSIDNTFNPGTGANDGVCTISIQSDGKIIIGGTFTSYNGTARNRIARLNANGSIDDTFNPGTGANFNIFTTSIQSDGKIIIGGNFTSYNGTAINSIARINADGTLDITFNSGAGGILGVSTTAIQSDGKIIIGGGFSSYNGTIIYCIARINADGSLDDTFNAGTGADDIVNTTAIQSDGKIIIGGYFTFYNNIAINRIARLNADGSLDETFDPGIGAKEFISAISIQGDGKIIVGIENFSYNETESSYSARLNADGSYDDTFNSGTGVNNEVLTSTIQSDGKIIIGGTFTSYNGIRRNHIARLNADGSLDGTFNPGTGANGTINATILQSDGKIIIVGWFTFYNGSARNRIARLNADGSLDETFNPGTGANNYVYTASIQSDGKIIIGGDFNSYNGTASNHIARLNSDGSLDVTFNVGTGAEDGEESEDYVWTTAIQSDGKIIIGGYFTSYNGTARNCIARLNIDGSLDNTFNPGTGVNYGVRTISIKDNGKIIIGGWFTSYNGTAINCIAQINEDGSLDSGFNSGVGTNNFIITTSLQDDGKIIIGCSYDYYIGTPRKPIARLNANGSIDDTFNVGTGANDYVNTTAIQSDGKIIIGGSFTSYNGIGRNRIARIEGGDLSSIAPTFEERIAVYPNPVASELSIEIPGNNEKTSFEILNSIGQVVFKGNLVEKVTVPTSNFTPGFYLVKVGNGKTYEFKKIIKQ